MFYSVAQHLVLCAEQALKSCPSLAFTVLMHDASEAYLADLPRPAKRMIPQYMEIEAGLEAAIAKKFGLFFPYPAEVKLIDNRMLATEAENFFKNQANKWWKNDPNYTFEPFANLLPDCIWGWPPHEAKERFLTMFRALSPVA